MESPPVTFAARYLVKGSIGSGSLGEVFQAWDTQLQRRVAIKRFAAFDLAGHDAYAAAWQEAINLAAMQHPNIVGVHDLGADDAGPFVIMELVEGETLEDVVARGAFPLADFYALARQSLEGLAAAHQVDLLHHDLKPGNLMLKRGPTDTLQVKLLDFGLSQSAFKAPDPSLPNAEEPATVLGTIEFLPPEVFERLPFDQRGDLYALGCIFYYALAGFCPFRGATASEVVSSHLEGRAEPLETVRKDLPKPLCAWVMRLISRQPGQRPASAGEAYKELEQIMAAPVAPPLPAARRRKRLAAGAAGLAALTALLAALGLGSAFRETNPLDVAAADKAIRPPPAGVRVQRVIAPAEAPVSAPAVYRADDLAGLRPFVGQQVTLEGKVAALRRDAQTGALSLDFAVDPAQAVSLVFPSEGLPEGLAGKSLESYLNRTVRASGQLAEREGGGGWQIAVEHAAQVEVR